MASAAPRRALPIAPPRGATPPPPGRDREKQRKVQLWIAGIFSVLVHALVLVLAFRAASLRLAPPEEAPPIHVRFADVPRDAVPSPVPPDTDVRSTMDTTGPEAPPDQPPRVARRSPPPEPSAPQPEVAEEVFEARPPADVPGVGPSDAEPPEISIDEKRRRVDSLLKGVGGPWSEGTGAQLGELEGGQGGGDDLQFESRADVDWGPYASRIKTIVRSNWRIPTAARVGMSGIVTVHFFIRRDGGIEELEVVQTSANVPLDVAARDAIALSDALPPPPLPEDLDEERVGVTWSFLYNVDDGQYRSWQRERRLERRRAGGQ